MKLATLKDGTRDGQLIVVSRDLRTAAIADGIVSTLQRALADAALQGKDTRLVAKMNALTDEDLIALTIAVNAMQIELNGKPHALADGADLAQLIAELELTGKAAAVASWSTSSMVLACCGCSVASSACRTLLLRDMWIKG